MDLESLGGLAIDITLSKLAPQDAASVACVSKRFRDGTSSDDLLWSKFCAHDLDLAAPIDPLGNPFPSFKFLLFIVTSLCSWISVISHCMGVLAHLELGIAGGFERVKHLQQLLEWIAVTNSSSPSTWC